MFLFVSFSHIQLTLTDDVKGSFDDILTRMVELFIDDTIKPVNTIKK